MKLGGGGTYKPRSYCPANHTCFKRATWTWWGSRTAKARADAHTVYPGAEPGVSGRITFTFDRPRNICGGRYFTRARWRYTSSEPYTEATVVAGGACYWSGA